MMIRRTPAFAAAFLLASSVAAHAQMSLAGRTLDPATVHAPARSEAPAEGTTVRLTPGMRPMVDVMVNGQGPFHFMVETTGAALELNSATRDRLTPLFVMVPVKCMVIERDWT